MAVATFTLTETATAARETARTPATAHGKMAPMADWADHMAGPTASALGDPMEACGHRWLAASATSMGGPAPKARRMDGPVPWAAGLKRFVGRSAITPRAKKRLASRAFSSA